MEDEELGARVVGEEVGFSQRLDRGFAEVGGDDDLIELGHADRDRDRGDAGGSRQLTNHSSSSEPPIQTRPRHSATVGGPGRMTLRYR